ncbi:peptidoglycan DD-metalloendopeptidase family protein [Bacillus sp. Xin]|uniref:M23 family metallopeptidase n=1 Tax=unclassified Bacillus (in: firmicutes) TaxID=185979 RepID=UPI0015734189|nr:MULTISPECIES: M23 family metallopeptidase [unclassified Bacillus (in: firmicutes)]MBC6976271.1 peptidoglycan DD-metalloendopeptidase family protein [Bacillus sp. Xin]NSW36179.1 peptidoglycan DD-metalloendopeptidase family protein [Bacillus sp. Xin1]
MRGRNNKKSRKVVHLFQKRWVFPALYIACAAVILSVALWFQAANPKKAPNKEQATPYGQTDNPAVPVTKSSEVVKMPVAKNVDVVVNKKFYEDAATEEEQEQALVFYNNTYSPNKGIDIAAKNGKEFDVTAALSGTVTKAEKDSLLGYVITVDNGNGLATTYQSLGSVKVEKGAKVAQGEVLGKSGLSAMNKEAGSHVHFEVRKDNVAVNPERYLNKLATDVKAEAGAAKATNGSVDEKATNGKTEEKSTSADEKGQKEEKSTSGSADEKQQKEEKSTNSSADDKQQKEEKSTNSSADEKGKKEEKSTNGSTESSSNSSSTQE